MHLRSKLLQIKICFWAAVRVLLMCLCVRSAHASAVVDPNAPNFTFTGSTCADLTSAWATNYMAANSITGLTAANCNPDPLAVGSVTFDFFISGGSGGTYTVDISSLDAGGSSGGGGTTPADTAESLAIDRLSSAIQSPDNFFGSLADLTTDDALNILLSVMTLWAIAWGFRQVAHSLNFERSHDEKD